MKKTQHTVTPPINKESSNKETEVQKAELTFEELLGVLYFEDSAKGEQRVAKTFYEDPKFYSDPFMELIMEEESLEKGKQEEAGSKEFAVRALGNIGLDSHVFGKWPLK